MTKLKPKLTKNQQRKALRRVADQIEFTFLLRIADLLKVNDETPEIRYSRLREKYQEILDVSVAGWEDLCKQLPILNPPYFLDKYAISNSKVCGSFEDWIQICLKNYKFYISKRIPYRKPVEVKTSPKEVKNAEG